MGKKQGLIGPTRVDVDKRVTKTGVYPSRRPGFMTFDEMPRTSAAALARDRENVDFNSLYLMINNSPNRTYRVTNKRSADIGYQDTYDYFINQDQRGRFFEVTGTAVERTGAMMSVQRPRRFTTYTRIYEDEWNSAVKKLSSVGNIKPKGKGIISVLGDE